MESIFSFSSQFSFYQEWRQIKFVYTSELEKNKSDRRTKMRLFYSSDVYCSNELYFHLFCHSCINCSCSSPSWTASPAEPPPRLNRLPGWTASPGFMMRVQILKINQLTDRGTHSLIGGEDHLDLTVTDPLLDGPNTSVGTQKQVFQYSWPIRKKKKWHKGLKTLILSW